MTWFLWGKKECEDVEKSLEEVPDMEKEISENTPEIEVASMEEEQNTEPVVSGLGFVNGETFMPDSKVHGGLVDLLQDKYGKSVDGGNQSGKSVETKMFKNISAGVSALENKHTYMESSLKQTLTNLTALKEFIDRGYDKVIEIGKQCNSEDIDNQLDSVKTIHKAVLEELESQLAILKNLLKIKIEPTTNDLSELIKKHKNYMKVMEFLDDHEYGSKEASDRLALAYSGITQTGMMKERVKEALKEIGMTVGEYKSTHNLTELRKKLYNILKKLPVGKLEGEEIDDIFMSMKVLEDYHVYKDMVGGNSKSKSTTTFGGMMKKVAKEYNETYSKGGVPRRPNGKKSDSSLTKRISKKEKTQEEIIKSFIADVNIRFNAMKDSVDDVSNKIGSAIPYDENMKEFISSFARLQELNRENLYFALIEYDETNSTQKQIKSQFLDDLDFILKSLDPLIKGAYGSYFNNIKQNILTIIEVIDTYTSVFSGVKNSKISGGKSGCVKKRVPKEYKDLTSNSINLISGLANKLEFYGKVATIRENLECSAKEHSKYSEGYDKLLGQAIGEEKTRINMEYSKNKAEIESGPEEEQQDKLLALKYDKEARIGLYNTIEAIDLYLMNFSDAIAKNPQAVSELEKMLQPTQIIAQWFVSKSGDNFKELLENEFETNEGAYEASKKAFESISVLKNIISMFIHIGEKFGSVKLQDKLHMSPNVIYKNLVKYVWVSAINKEEKKLKTIDADLGYQTDDGYFVMCIQAIVSKILTVVGTYSIFKKPEKPQNMITNPVRLILGGNNETPEIIDDAIELYIRLPLLVEFYKKIFDDGNNPYKQNQSPNDDAEIIAFIPEMGSLWSGLIKIIFDNSKFISNAGLYSIQNIKDIVREINTIYKYYAAKDKKMITREAFCGLISEINRRYGILKKCDVNEYYQLQKRYKSTYLENSAELNTNFDILNSMDERNAAGPSALYTQDPLEPTKIETTNSIKSNDLKLVKEFRDRVESSLDMRILEEVAPYSFNERLRFYRDELKRTTGNENKFDLVMKAIEQSTDTSKNNSDAYILFHELVVAPCNTLQALYKISVEFGRELEKSIDDENVIRTLELLFVFTGDMNGLIELKFITNSKMAITYDKLESVVSKTIDNIKYMISKFRNIVNPAIIEQFENPSLPGSVYYLEDLLLNHIIKNSVAESETEDDRKQLYNSINTLDSFIDKLNKFLDGKSVRDIELFEAILWNVGKTSIIDVVPNIEQPMADAFRVFNPKDRTWKPASLRKVDRVFDLNGIVNDNNRGIVAKFNKVLNQYLSEFYDNSTHKIYLKLFNHTAEHTFSSIVYGKGINDLTTSTSGIPNTRKTTPENNIVLSASIAYTMKILISRSLNPQLADKYHAIYDIQNVSPHMVEQYRAKLPIFIKLFKFLSDKCVIYKRLLENNDILAEDIIDADVDGPFPEFNALDDDGNPLEITAPFKPGPVQKAERLADYRQILNNVIEGCSSIIKDAELVLDEVISMDGKTGLFFELKNDFIKDYYMVSKTLPFMPASSMLYAFEKPAVMYPTNKLHTPSFKFLYGTRTLINGETQQKALEQMPYMKEIITNYNNSMRAGNQIDMKNLEQLVEELVTFTKTGIDMLSYKQLLTKVELSADFLRGNLTFSLSKSLEQVIDLTQNTFVESNKNKLFTYVYKFADEVGGTGVMENKTRDHARLLNIIDVNVIPVNVHALMKEVPLANIYNYSISYGHMLDKELSSEGASGLFKKMLKDPYTPIDLSSNDAKAVINGNIPELHLFRPRFLADQLWVKCEMEENPERFDKKIVRDTAWFVNIQRMLRRKIRNELSEIKTKVIEDNKITSTQLTDYAGEHTEQDNNEFEFVF